MAALLAAVGATSVAAALIGLSISVAHDVLPLRQAAAPLDAQRFAFDRAAWRAVPFDDVFLPVYHADAGGVRDFTRIGVAPAADCRAAFDPGLVRLLSAYHCGPVFRVDYTDASRTLVATVGVAVLGTAPADQRDLHAATVNEHDDLRPKALAFPNTAAAGFGDGQRAAVSVLAREKSPFLAFAVVGFSDGRPATADQASNVLSQSGIRLVAGSLQDMAGTRLELGVDGLWDRRR